MSKKILILMKDEKYLKALNDFFSKKLPDAKLVAVKTVKEMTLQPLSEFHIVICSSMLSEGTWLKSLPILKRVKHIILLLFPDGPQITEDIAKKYGISKLFNVPLNSNELLQSVKELIAAIDDSQKNKGRLSDDFIDIMKSFYFKLDKIDYYEIFSVDKSTEISKIKASYIQIARKYHPDKFRRSDEEIKNMAYEITKRANEAYSVLSHPNRKKIYDKMLKENRENIRFDFHIKVNYEENPQDTIQNPQVRRFVELAMKAMNEKSYKQAMTQLKMANSMEKGNKYIEGLIEKVTKLISEGE